MTSGPTRIGWIGLDAPVEVLAAAGAPFRLDADPSAPSPLASPFGEGGGHPAMRATAHRVLAEAGAVQRIVIGSMPVTGVWLYNFFLTLERGRGAPALPPLDLVNISHEGRPSAARHNRDAIDALIARLDVPREAVRTAIRERNAVRAVQRRIDALRHGPERRLTGSQARRLLDAADQMQAQDYLPMAEDALAQAGLAPPDDMTPVIYSGPGSPSLDLYVALEAQGLSVMADDADFGSRAIGPDVDESGDPADALARRYAARSPAPAGWTTARRVEWLAGLVTTTGARTVVFDLPAWSHPPAWDFPAERRALEAMGVACILTPQAPPAEAAAAVAKAFRSSESVGGAHV